MSARVLAVVFAVFLSATSAEAVNVDRKALLLSIFNSEVQLPDEIFTRGPVRRG